jgi:hypothetical protein
MDTPPVTQDDLLNPPVEMLAIEGEIVSIVPLGQLGPKPHSGFNVKFRVVKVYQGDYKEKYITIEFGPCHNSPGNAKSIVPVLAIKSKDSKSAAEWYAPQFWNRTVSAH